MSAPVPSPRLAGVLAARCDHKPWPRHPGDAAGGCQGCRGTAIVFASGIVCVQNDVERSASTGRSSGLRITVAVGVLMVRIVVLRGGG